MFSLNQITNPSLNCTSESTDAVDALQVPIATFYRAKTCEFSAENALFDMNLLATQAGSKKKIAAANVAIHVPAFEEVECAAAGTYSLKHTPDAEPKVYILNKDGTVGAKLVKDTVAATRTKYAYTAAAGDAAASITYVYDAAGSAGFSAGDTLFVMYEYTAANNKAIEVSNSAQNFPTACKFTMEILGADVCTPTDKVYAYLVFPNCKLSPDFDWSIATDSTHPFSMKAMQDYCSRDKKLFSIIIPDDEG